jgi:energy-coupling factor transport system permease protein
MLVFILSFIGLRNGLSRLKGYLLIFVFFFAVSFIVNFIFTNTGTTVLFQIDELPLIGGHKRLSLEMLVFTFTASLRLVYILLVFVFVMQVSSEDRVMAFFSQFLKNFPLLLSFTVRLIPKLRSDYKRLTHVFKLRGFEVVKSVKKRKGIFRRIKDSINLRLMLALIRTLLMNSLEDSLQYAEAMQARGYGDYSSRSTFYKERFGILDGLLLSLSMVYLGLCIGLSASGIGIKGIYPIFRLNHYLNMDEMLGMVLFTTVSLLLYLNSYYIVRR